MLQFRVRPSARPWSSRRRFDDQRSYGKTTAHGIADSAHKPSSILSRLSERTESSIRRNSDTGPKSPNTRTDVVTTAHRKPRSRATSFISARSAQERDHAAEKWFKDVRELHIDNVDQSNGLKLLSHKKRMKSEFPKQHSMRPRTDLNALFAPSCTRSAASSRLQTKKELGGDYTSYLPDGYTDPYRLPLDYARLVLGRNKHIPLNAQAGALNIIKEATQGRTTRRVV